MDSASTHTLATARLRRVAAMGIAEIGYRSRQEGSKWIDRIRLGGGRSDAALILRRYAPGFADPTLAREAITRTFDQHFFAGASADAAATIAARYPSHASAITDEADRLLAGRFDLLGYRDLMFGRPIDWHLDPVNARRSPLVHWSKIDPLDASTTGDSKVVWEINRHQWLVRLAQAQLLTSDARYGWAAIDAIEHWIAANPVGYGINWSSSLEVSLRLMAWSWVLALLRRTDAMPDAALMALLSSIHAHAGHILRYLSYYYSPNTHLTGEALGLFYAGVLFPQFRDSARWQRTGAETLIAQADRQISSDGVYFEQSTCYQRYSCDILLHFLLLADRSGYPVPQRTRDHVARMTEFLLDVRRPDGSMPAIGDADGGWLLPLSRRAADDISGTVAIAAATLARTDFPVEDAPERVWLLGAAPTNVAPGCAVRVPQSRLYAAGGYAIMRSDAAADAHHLIIDVGPLGCHVSAGHGHADLLSIQCAIFGEPCLIDAGTGSYTGDATWRHHFRSSFAHNTLSLDGRGQAEPAGPFRWHSRPSVRLRGWQSTPAFDLIDAEHDAYGPVMHRRRVLFVKPRFWLVIDDVSGDAGPHDLEFTFQFAPVSVTLTSSHLAKATTTSGATLWLMPFASVTLDSTIACGEEHPMRGWVSPDYGQRVPAPVVSYSASTPSLPVRVLTVLYPDRDGVSPPRIEPIVENGWPSGVRIGTESWIVHRDAGVTLGH